MLAEIAMTTKSVEEYIVEIMHSALLCLYSEHFKINPVTAITANKQTATIDITINEQIADTSVLYSFIVCIIEISSNNS